MTIRDICMMHPELALEDLSDAFPADTWVRQVADNLGCTATSDSEIKAFFRERCRKREIEITLFAAGMWYLGANALPILVKEFLPKYEIAATE